MWQISCKILLTNSILQTEQVYLPELESWAPCTILVRVMLNHSLIGPPTILRLDKSISSGVRGTSSFGVTVGKHPYILWIGNNGSSNFMVKGQDRHVPGLSRSSKFWNNHRIVPPGNDSAQGVQSRLTFTSSWAMITWFGPTMREIILSPVLAAN